MDSARPPQITLPPDGPLERMVLGSPVAVPVAIWAKLVCLADLEEPPDDVLLYEGATGRWLVRKA